MRYRGNGQSIVMEKKVNFTRVFKVVRLLVDENERLRRENAKLKRLLREGLALISRLEKQK